MGLISFLKNKFSKKKEDNVVNKYSDGLAKSRQNFSSKLTNLASRYKKVNQDYFEELEEILIESDISISLTIKIIDEVLEESESMGIDEPTQINEILVDKMFLGYASKGDVSTDIEFDGGMKVLLVVGVNGVGKTTTIAKLAHRYISKGKKVLLVAADTFRAGAKEQLCVWGERLGVDVVFGPSESDPASVAYDGMKKAKVDNVDLVIVDTAGRLQTKTNLMAELAKIKRVIGKEVEGAPHETFLVIDATTGQNGIIQAKEFSKATGVTGIVVTKLDGTAKGGMVFAIVSELKIPIRFIGVGEGIDDFYEFNAKDFVNGILD